MATPDDAAAIAAIYHPYVAETPISLEEVPPTPEDMAARIEVVLPDYPWIVAERDGEIAGYAYASRHHPRSAYRWGVDVGIYVARERRGGGTGRALYRALLALVRAQGFETAYGGVTLPNAASVALHESFGFAPVGIYRRAGYKCGAWWDVGWWGVVLGGAQTPPAEPVPFAELRTRPGWDDCLHNAA